MSNLSDLLLTGLLNHGAALLGGTLFLAAFGIPLPATMLLMAAGAFAQQGVLGLPASAAAALAGSAVGDTCSYAVGRFGIVFVPAAWRAGSSWSNAQRLFARWGGWGVFVTRFALTPVALPVNLLAGSTRYPWPRFAGAVLAGESLWVLWVGGAGYLFADRWESMSRIASDSGVRVEGGSGTRSSKLRRVSVSTRLTRLPQRATSSSLLRRTYSAQVKSESLVSGMMAVRT